MIGGIVGVGVFGLPYAVSRAGAVPGILVVLGVCVVLTLLQLMTAEVAIQTGGDHRITGYIRTYLGKRTAAAAMAVFALGLWGALTAYIIIGGTFLHTLASPVFGGAPGVYSLVIAALASALMSRGIRFASLIEIPVVIALFFLFSFIVLASLPHVEVANLLTADLTGLFTPYGVVLFAAAGTGIVPEMHAVLGRRAKRLLQPAILLAMFLIILLYVVFSLVVVGVTGAATSQDAFTGLLAVLGPSFGAIAALLGTATIISIYMILGVELMNMLRYDFKVPQALAWALTAAVPIALFLLGVTDFIELIGFIGGALVGLIGIFLVLMYEKMRRSPVCKAHHCLNLPHAVSWIIILVLLGGSVWEVVRTIG